MTPTEQSIYLIKELGKEQALHHALWAVKQCWKPDSKRFWREVIDAIIRENNPQSDK